MGEGCQEDSLPCPVLFMIAWDPTQDHSVLGPALATSARKNNQLPTRENHGPEVLGMLILEGSRQWEPEI